MASYICEACGQPVETELDHYSADECVTALLERVDELERQFRGERGWKHPAFLDPHGKKERVYIVMEAEYHPGYFSPDGAGKQGGFSFASDSSGKNFYLLRQEMTVAWRPDDGQWNPLVDYRVLPLAEE